MQVRTAVFAALALSAAMEAPGALADVIISSDATQNMTCSGGVCQPTASSAVLNVNDLQTLLAGGNVEITSTGSGGVQASNIDVASAFSWSSSNGLSLDAEQSLTFTAAVGVTGTGSLSLTTNDGGSGGLLLFLKKGTVDFSSPANTLVINNTNYKLETNIKSLAYDIVGNPGGAFALAGNIDANKHIYRASPIPVYFSGSFSGLGHVISNLEVVDLVDDGVGLFAALKTGGSISGIGVENVHSIGTVNVGGLVGFVETGALVTNSWVSGVVSGGSVGDGGLTGENDGTVSNSWSSAQAEGGTAGSLVGANDGSIETSFATGSVASTGGGGAGGLVGFFSGKITNAYSAGAVAGSPGDYAGGLVGYVDSGSVTNAYASGRVRNGREQGGFIGVIYDTMTAGSDYWDISRNKNLQGVGEGSESGITALTTPQFRSGLPSGFDPSIWAQDKKINRGFPYLIANPPARQHRRRYPKMPALVTERCNPESHPDE